MPPFLQRLRFRAPAFVAAGALGAIAATRSPAPPPNDLDGIRALLAEGVGDGVEVDRFVWEPSAGPWRDLLWGRRALFLARQGGGPRDLYRARVHVTREGRALSTAAVHNLTHTPLADESDLRGRGPTVAFLTRSFGKVQAATALDLRGHALEGLDDRTRLRTMTANLLEEGSRRGVKRHVVAFGKPPLSAKLELREGLLVLALGDDAAPASLDLTSGAFNGGKANPYRGQGWSIPQRVRPPAHFVMDSMRLVLGTERADSIKAVLFGTRGKLREAIAGHEEPAPPEPLDPEPPLDPLVSTWPPADLKPHFEHPLEGEGRWSAWAPEWLPKARGTTGKAAPYFVRTVIRPDRERPFAEVHLVAMDTRQLTLGIEAGFDEPRPTSGPRGRGRIADADRPAVVGAFNGAFQTRHGAYGMVVRERVLLPPAPRAATVAIDARGDVWMGDWGATEAVPPNLVSLRQNLDPLIADGRINPRHRKRWGFPLDVQLMGDEPSYLTERSALCTTKSGHLIYGYGMELLATTLALALQQAGCRYAIHLDMNPGHVGFVAMDAGAKKPHTALLARTMSIAPNRFLEASPKDFFTVKLRDPTPRAGGLTWVPEKAAHPPPAWLPAVYTASRRELGTEVGLQLFLPGRFDWQMRPGAKEKAGRTAEAGLDEATTARAMAAVGLGRGFRRRNRRGLVLDGVVTLPMRADLAALVAGEDGQLRIEPTYEGMAPEGDASELRWLVRKGKILPEARELGARRRRSAACLLATGELVVASSTFDSAQPNARALVAAGCQSGVDLDRGHQVRAFVHRAGTSASPQGRYDDTVLYGMARSAHGRVRTLSLP